MTFAHRIAVNAATRARSTSNATGTSRAIVQAYLPSAAGVELLDTRRRHVRRRRPAARLEPRRPLRIRQSSFALFLHERLGAGGSRTAARNVLARENDRRRAALRPAAALVPRRAVRQRRTAAGASPRGAGRRGVRVLGGPGRGAVPPSSGGSSARRARKAGIRDSHLLDLRQRPAGGPRTGGRGRPAPTRRRTGQSSSSTRPGAVARRAFDLYARGLGEKLRNDWAKVQGRFQERLLRRAAGTDPAHPRRRVLEHAHRRGSRWDVRRRAGRFRDLPRRGGSAPGRTRPGRGGRRFRRLLSAPSRDAPPAAGSPPALRAERAHAVWPLGEQRTLERTGAFGTASQCIKYCRCVRAS